jgi:hypothetical protein
VQLACSLPEVAVIIHSVGSTPNQRVKLPRVYLLFHASKNDMSNITEISKKNIQLGTFHLVAEF